MLSADSVYTDTGWESQGVSTDVHTGSSHPRKSPYGDLIVTPESTPPTGVPRRRLEQGPDPLLDSGEGVPVLTGMKRARR